MDKKIFSKLPIWVILILVVLIGCKKAVLEKGNRKTILTTTGMIADAVKNIVKDSANVESLMESGVDPHLFKATYSDVEGLVNSDIVFYNGLHLEGKLQEVLQKLAKIKPVVPISENLPLDCLIKIPGTKDSYDPHIWFDIKKWQTCILHISKVLQEKDSVHANYYKENTRNYLNQLDSLQTYTITEFNKIPKPQRVLITAHDAFGYFGKACSIEVKGLQGISTLSEFGLKDVSQLVNFIVNRKIKAVFVETSVPQKSIEAVIEGCKARGHSVEIGGTLYSDAMGPSNSPEGTYLGMFKANVNTIVKALK